MHYLYLHVGFPKTGTTTLQAHAFPSIEEVNYLGKFYPLTDPRNSWSGTAAITIATKPRRYCREKPEDFLRGIGLDPDHLTGNSSSFLLSNEGIIGVCLASRLRNTHVEQADQYHRFGPCVEDLLQKLQLVDAAIQDRHNMQMRIILSIRRQDELLHSYYVHHPRLFDVLSGGGSFEAYATHLLSRGYFCHGGYVLDYAYLLGKMHECFGKENVCMLVYEWMQDKPQAFAGKLAEFIGADHKVIERSFSFREKQRAVSPSTRTKSVHKFTPLGCSLRALKRAILRDSSVQPHLLRRAAPFLYSTHTVEYHLSEETRELIMRHYRSMNRELADMVGVKLDHYGYY